MNKGKAQADEFSIPFLNLAEFFGDSGSGIRWPRVRHPRCGNLQPDRPTTPYTRTASSTQPVLRRMQGGSAYFLTDSRLFWEWNQPCRREFVYYLCNNCGHCMKTYAVEMTSSEVEGVGEVFKYGGRSLHSGHMFRRNSSPWYQARKRNFPEGGRSGNQDSVSGPSHTTAGDCKPEGQESVAEEIIKNRAKAFCHRKMFWMS